MGHAPSTHILTPTITITTNTLHQQTLRLSGKKDNAIGICRLVSSLAGGPTFWLSGPISRKIGVNGVLSVTLLAFGLRFIMYSFMQVGSRSYLVPPPMTPLTLPSRTLLSNIFSVLHNYNTPFQSS